MLQYQKDTAINSIVNAVTIANPDCSKLILRIDNGPQYNSKDFKKAVILGIKHEFIWASHTKRNK